MAFSRTQYDAARDRLEKTIGELRTGYRAAFAAQYGGTPAQQFIAAARAGDTKAMAGMIDVKRFLRETKDGNTYVRMSNLVRGQEGYESSLEASAGKYHKKLRAVSEKYLDAYITTGKPIDIADAVKALRAVPQI